MLTCFIKKIPGFGCRVRTTRLLPLIVKVPSFRFMTLWEILQGQSRMDSATPGILLPISIVRKTTKVITGTCQEMYSPRLISSDISLRVPALEALWIITITIISVMLVMRTPKEILAQILLVREQGIIRAGRI